MALVKSADAFRTISEAADELAVPQHVLRHWEEMFGQIRPMRRAGGRRYYRPVDIDVLRGVRALLYEARYTTKGVQKIFRENGVRYVAEIGRLAAAGQPLALRPLLDEDADDRAAEGIDAEANAMGGAAIYDDEAVPDALRRRLGRLLETLERAQGALDEATLAVEAIQSNVEPGDR
jgi:DNA-binding transcriptional MerR regulator